MNPTTKHALINSISVSIYVTAIATLFNILGKTQNTTNSILIPITMLLLLVFSVALMGTLIFGRPLIWYLDNKKKEAIQLLAYTILFIFAITLIAIISLILIL